MARKRGPYDFAEKLLREEFNVKRLAVDPIALARQRDIHVEAMPEEHEGASGMLIHAHDKFAITYATHIRNEGFQNFSVAHELGHYFLPDHIDAVLPEGATHHASQSGFVSDNRYELEADHFAAGLLMPSFLFRPAMTGAGDGLDAIIKLRGLCRTSLIATAIRYQQLTDEAVAIIQSRGEKIEFCFMSDRMLSLHPLRWPRKGDKLPINSKTYRLNQSPDCVASSERADDETAGAYWFGSLDDVELYEEAIGLGTYGRTLTVISTVDALPDEEDGEDTNEAWRPKF
jgi:hypothetical protein